MRYRTILILTTALLSSGCDRKAEGQTVAVVNNEEITTSELNAELAQANLTPGLDKKAATSQVLQAMIDRRLLAQQARADGIDRSPEFLSRQRRATEDLFINILATRKLKTTKLPTAAEVESFEASRPERFAQREFWNIEQIQYATPTDATVLKQIMASNDLATLARILDTAGIEYQKSKTRLNSEVVPNDMFKRIGALPEGGVFIVPAGNLSVANVIVSKEPAPLVGAAARPAAVAALRQEQGAKILENQLRGLREKAKIEYKENFAPK